MKFTERTLSLVVTKLSNVEGQKQTIRKGNRANTEHHDNDEGN